MPTITPSPVITDSAQVNAGVITSSDIANDSIVDADINSAAAIAGSKLQALSVGVNAGVIPSTGIVNDHIAAAAGIVDTKLATISTAGKVDGAAITGLASVPAGAGVLPAANLPPASLSQFTASDTLQASADTERSKTANSYSMVKEIKVRQPGTIRVKFDMKGGGSNPGNDRYGRIYKNGSAVGTERASNSTNYITYSEDLAFVANDLVQLYYKSESVGAGSVYVKNFRLYWTSGPLADYTVNTD